MDDDPRYNEEGDRGGAPNSFGECRMCTSDGSEPGGGDASETGEWSGGSCEKLVRQASEAGRDRISYLVADGVDAGDGETERDKPEDRDDGGDGRSCDKIDGSRYGEPHAVRVQVENEENGHDGEEEFSSRLHLVL